MATNFNNKFESTGTIPRSNTLTQQQHTSNMQQSISSAGSTLKKQVNLPLSLLNGGGNSQHPA